MRISAASSPRYYNAKCNAPRRSASLFQNDKIGLTCFIISRAAAFLSSVTSSPMTTQATAATQSSIYSKTYTEWSNPLDSKSNSLHLSQILLNQPYLKEQYLAILR